MTTETLTYIPDTDMKAKKIEAEGSELILRNEHGDYVIIPKKHRLS